MKKIKALINSKQNSSDEINFSNIEAEIARRMGQPQPNPVEFGLLPAGTLPVLSGGQPRMASLGGAIEELLLLMAEL